MGNTEKQANSYCLLYDIVLEAGNLGISKSDIRFGAKEGRRKVSVERNQFFHVSPELVCANLRDEI